MKIKQIIITTALLVSFVTFAQKDQIKAAEKALKSGNAAEAKTILQQAESLLSAATDAEKAQYYYVKATALLDLASKNIEVLKNQTDAAKSFVDLLATEKASGKTKYTDQAKPLIVDFKDKLISGAIENAGKENYTAACQKLKTVYDLDKTDLEKLYYAANYAINAKDYDTALQYFTELKTLNFTGESTNYYAKSLVKNEEEYFGNTADAKKDRDSKVLMKIYSAPRDEKIASRKGEIHKNIVLILLQQGKDSEAKAAISDARKANPDDVSLIITEADLYLKSKDYDNYTKLVNEALAKDPNNVDLVYNLGVISADAKKLDDAEKYYRRAIEIDSKYFNAYLNLAELLMRGDEKFVKEMNSLGTSEKDNKRFDVIKAERNKNFMVTMPILEKAVELDATNDAAKKTLLSLYNALEMTDKYKALKAKL
jgi:tetratricopeptide (TPR) repeat protein